MNATKPSEKYLSALAVEIVDISSKLPRSNRISIMISGITNKATDDGTAIKSA